MPPKNSAETGRKPDRRAAYTRRTVKDALLELLKEMPFEQITVTSLCRQAEITRATFYIHFSDIDEVLDELLDEALMTAEAASNDMSIESRLAALGEVVRKGDAGDLQRNEKLLSPCQRVADDPKYRAIFQDTTLASYVIRRIYTMERDEFTAYLTRRYRLTEQQADRLFMIIVYGLFYMNRSLQWKKDADWYEMQLIFDRFLFGGFEALRDK